jgi:protein-S-isoprenylcysteine O-methyltransferase Ste14
VSRPVGCGSFDCVVPDGYGLSLLGAQLAAVAGVFWPGEPRWRLPRVVAVGAATLLVGGNVLAAAGALGLGRSLRPLPHLPSGATLRTDGAYGVVRHPIYAGVLLASMGGAVLRARPGPLVALAVLAAVLHLKAGYEERLLREQFGAAYDEYAQRVSRMVPGIRTAARRRVRRRLPVGAGARSHT